MADFVCLGCGLAFDPSDFVYRDITGLSGLKCGSDSLRVWLCCRDCWDSRGDEFRQSVVDAATSRFRSLVQPVFLTFANNAIVESESDRERYNAQMALVDRIRSECLSVR